MLRAVDEAEARGDARAALELIERDLASRGGETDFWRLERLRRLIQLAVIGPMLPGWVTSRWILAQAAQWLEPSRRGVGRKALDRAIEARGGPAALVGVDEPDARMNVMDHDWVYRQLLLYEFGALQHFLSRVAAADLVAGADRIHERARAPMGSFRLVDEPGQKLVWCEMAAGQEIETPDVGAAALLVPGECAIGRLVPIEGGAMFESAPLVVPDDVAHRVAEDPPGWLAPVADGCRRAGDDRIMTTGGHDFAMTTDVPRFLQQTLALEVAEALGGTAHLELPKQHITLEVDLVRAAMDDRLPPEVLAGNPWPAVAATLLHPSVFLAFGTGLRPADRPGLLRLADRLAGPAGGVCRALADDLEEAA